MSDNEDGETVASFKGQVKVASSWGERLSAAWTALKGELHYIDTIDEDDDA